MHQHIPALIIAEMGIVNIQAYPMLKAADHLTEIIRRAVPTPITEDDMICAVLTGPPAREATSTTDAVLIWEPKGWTGSIRQMPWYRYPISTGRWEAATPVGSRI